MHLDDERDPVGVPARHRAEHTERGRNRVASALDGQFDDVGRIEVQRVGSERGRCRMLDALIDRKDRQVAGVGQATVTVDLAKAAQHRRRSIRLGE
jgi:hypothetical protein